MLPVVDFQENELVKVANISNGSTGDRIRHARLVVLVRDGRCSRSGKRFSHL